MGWRTPETGESMQDLQETTGTQERHEHESWAELTQAVQDALIASDLKASELRNGNLDIMAGFDGDRQIIVLDPEFEQPKPWQVALGLTRELLESELRSGGLQVERWGFRPMEPGAMLGLDSIPGRVSAIYGRLVSLRDGAPLSEMPLEDRVTCLVLETDQAEASHALVRIVIPPDQINQFLTLVYRRHDAASDIFARPDVLVERGETRLDRPTVYYALLDLGVTRERGWL